jgi:hypothetical protein
MGRLRVKMSQLRTATEEGQGTEEGQAWCRSQHAAAAEKVPALFPGFLAALSLPLVRKSLYADSPSVPRGTGLSSCRTYFAFYLSLWKGCEIDVATTKRINEQTMIRIISSSFLLVRTSLFCLVSDYLQNGLEATRMPL